MIGARVRHTVRSLYVVLGLIALAGALFALSLVQGGQAVETSGTIQTCVSKYTHEIIVRNVCNANEDWLLIEGVYNPPPPPTRPAS